MKLACLVLGATFNAVAATSATAPPDRLAGLSAELDRRAAADLFAGAVLVARDGEVVYAQARGFADREKKIANTLETRFRLGSMNKMFTAVAILQLAQAGKVKLDAPLGKYLRDYPNAETARVTLHQLLTHTGGTGDIFGPEFEAHRPQLREPSDYIAQYGKRAPAFPPGTRHEYSNYGFILLGRIVEVVSGQSYYDYVRTHIYAPSGMTATDSLPEEAHVPLLSVPYTGKPPDLQSASETLPYRGTPAGGGYSTVGDMLKFALALNAHRLLDAEHTELLTTGKVDTPMRDTRYAYGFEDVHLANGLHRIGHSGGATGMNGLLAIYPDEHFVLVSLANRDPPEAMQVARLVLEAVILPAHAT